MTGIELLSIRVFPAGDLRPVEQGRYLLNLVERYLPPLAPVVCGPEETLRERWAPSSLGRLWGDGFMWRGTSPRANGMVQFAAPARRNALVSLDVPGEEVVAPELVPVFLRECSTRFGADFACAQLMTDAEAVHAARGTVASDPFGRDPPRLSIYPRTLQRSVPDIYWATFLGLPYVRLFGRNRLASLQTFAVSELACGWYVQLTETYRDVELDGERFEEARRRAKLHLGSAAFFDMDRPYGIVPPELSETLRLVGLLNQLVACAGTDASLAQRFLAGALRLPPPGGGEAAVLLRRLALDLESGAPSVVAGQGELTGYWQQAEVQRKLAATLAELDALPPPPEVRVSELGH